MVVFQDAINLGLAEVNLPALAVVNLLLNMPFNKKVGQPVEFAGKVVALDLQLLDAGMMQFFLGLMSAFDVIEGFSQAEPCAIAHACSGRLRIESEILSARMVPGFETQPLPHLQKLAGNFLCRLFAARKRKPRIKRRSALQAAAPRIPKQPGKQPYNSRVHFRPIRPVF